MNIGIYVEICVLDIDEIFEDGEFFINLVKWFVVEKVKKVVRLNLNKIIIGSD